MQVGPRRNPKLPKREDQTPRIAENLLLRRTCDCCINRATPPVSKVVHCSARREHPTEDTCIRYTPTPEKARAELLFDARIW